MTLKEVKELAKRMNLRVTNVRKTDIIRTIQRSEGNNDCFKTGYANECSQFNCLWRQDCSSV
jgi:hypothetical protein